MCRQLGRLGGHGLALLNTGHRQLGRLGGQVRTLRSRFGQFDKVVLSPPIEIFAQAQAADISENTAYEYLYYFNIHCGL